MTPDEQIQRLQSEIDKLRAKEAAAAAKRGEFDREIDSLSRRSDESIRWAIEEFRGIPLDCNETAHGMADQILLKALRANGLGVVADAWETTSKFVSFWYS